MTKPEEPHEVQLTFDHFKEFYQAKFNSVSYASQPITILKGNLTETLKAEFALMDVDGQGSVTLSNLKKVIHHDLKMNIDDERILEEMLRCCNGTSDTDIQHVSEA
jgi:Ca2+-binding EF-hand superfamily protein